ncbi:sterol desaturase family protein [Variovorax dokdonensis]|uniref:Sterol desaturase family protein n=1 Tax=Variovorax dokdonensis TaxID=344883 RepID=A0ABT7N7D6_9BURK|nr:sterol desaturase family protein [Variovorax dokdonensis]MDM0043856.1 sterol desaturase family protein [Variovorax dokdonensis]
MKKLWDYDFNNARFKWFTYFLPLFIILFVAFDVLGDTGAKLTALLLSEIDPETRKYADAFPSQSGYTVLGVAVLSFISLYVALHAWLAMVKAYPVYGRHRTQVSVWTHACVNVIDFAVSALLIGGIWAALAMAGELDLGVPTWLQPELVAPKVEAWVAAHVPTLVSLPYLLAVFASIVLADLATFLRHYLVHWSRLLWYVSHRVHHTAEVLHPAGVGPAYALGFLTKAVEFMVLLMASKLFHHEPLLMEVLVFQMLTIMTEKFNHASAFYDWVCAKPWLKVVFHFFGAGPYHYMHHSAVEGEEINNLGGGGFMLWDKLFGTYVAPRATKPPVGLTNQPKIRMNPLAMYFSGWATIAYELRHNSVRHWFFILFGSVNYKPPRSKEYLIMNYSPPAEPARHVSPMTGLAANE